MGIVLKWNFKTLFSDIPRLILTICSIAVTTALLTSMSVTVGCFVLRTDSPGGSLPDILNGIVSPVILAAYAVTVYTLFAVSLAERKNQYHIMKTAGCTTRQLLKGLILEAVALDLAGSALGIGLGILISAAQLKIGGYPLILPVIFRSSTLYRNLLPALLLPPVMMLPASIQLLFPRRDRRRIRPARRKKSVFARRFPRLFGTGGALEYALEHNERRHHTALVVSLAVNLAVLILGSSCFYLLSHAEPYGDDCGAWVWYYSGDADDSALSADLDELIDEGLQSEDISSYSELRANLGNCGMVIDNKLLSDEVLYLQSKETAEQRNSRMQNTLFPLDDSRQILLITVVFMDDGMYGQFKSDCGIASNEDGAVFVNACGIAGNTTAVLREPTLSSASLCFYPRGVAQKAGLPLGEHSFDVTALQNAQADAVASAQIPVVGVVPFSPEIHQYFWLVVGSPNLILPMKMRNALLPPTDEGENLRFCKFKTPDPAALCLRINEKVRGFSDYQFRELRFGSAHLQLASDGASIVLGNIRALSNDYGAFLRQLINFYRVILFFVFISIGLNIVNTVHMNRISRRREYAILASIGLGKRQRRGMLLFESARYLIKGVLLSALIAISVSYHLDDTLVRAVNAEMIWIQTNNLIYTNTDSPNSFVRYFQIAWNYIANIANILAEHRWVTVGAVCFLFFGFLLTEALVLKRMDRYDLVPTLKDDLHE